MRICCCHARAVATPDVSFTFVDAYFGSIYGALGNMPSGGWRRPGARAVGFRGMDNSRCTDEPKVGTGLSNRIDPTVKVRIPSAAAFRSSCVLP